MPNFYLTCKPDFGNILQSLNKNDKIDGEEQARLFDIESHIQIGGIQELINFQTTCTYCFNSHLQKYIQI